MNWVFLDAGNTLVEINAERVADVSSHCGATIDASAFREVEQRVRFELDTSDLVSRSNDHDRFFIQFDRILEELGVVEDVIRCRAVEALREEHRTQNLWDHVEPFVIPTLEALCDSGYRLAVVSNAHGDVETLLQRVGVADQVEAVIDSGVIGIEKPDPRIFHEAFAELEIPMGTKGVYVGDIYHIDVICARAAGLTGILLDPLDLHTDKPCPRLTDISHLPGWLAEQN